MEEGIQVLIVNFLIILMLLGNGAFLKMHKSKLDDKSPNSAYRAHTIVKYGHYLFLIVFIPYFVISTLVSLLVLVAG